MNELTSQTPEKIGKDAEFSYRAQNFMDQLVVDKEPGITPEDARLMSDDHMEIARRELGQNATEYYNLALAEATEAGKVIKVQQTESPTEPIEVHKV